MSSPNFGLKNDWVQGATVTAQEMNDLHNLLDNQVGYLISLCLTDGVVSGWTITQSLDVKVAAGEAWVSRAHCKTIARQSITGLTGSVLNYIYAQRLTPSPIGDAVSESLTLGSVAFVANTTGTAPTDSILLATGTPNAGCSAFTSVDNAPVGRVTLPNIMSTLQTILEAAGVPGDKGDTGDPGPAGEQGSVILADYGAPYPGTGRVGDCYVDLLNAVFYGPKTEAGWVTSFSISGGGGGSTVHCSLTVSYAEPTSPQVNDLWVPLDAEDPNVTVVGPRITIDDTEPLNPQVDDLWVDIS